MAVQIPQLIARSAAGGANAATTPAMVNTGATLLVAAVSVTAASAPAVITSSPSTTWTALTGKSVTGNQNTQLFYAANPTVSGSQTITATLSGGGPGLVSLAFSGIVTASPFDQQNGTSGATSSTTIQPGAITPSQNGSLIITALGQGASLVTDGQIMIDDLVSSIFAGGFGIIAVGGTNFGTIVAFGIQGTAATINPTWKLVQGSGINSNLTSVIACFKPATAASGGGTTGYASA